MEYWWLVPLLAGLILTLGTGPLGCFVVWRRMAFFGETLAHGALLGVTLGVLFDINLTLALVFSSLALALLLLSLKQQSLVGADTLLGILSHGALATGLVLLSTDTQVRVDLMGYLFGDLLAIGQQQLTMVAIASGFTLVFIISQWRGLLSMTVSQELASIEGVPVKRLDIALTLLLAFMIAMSMKVVGILLISALLVTPAASARIFSRSPLSMALRATLLGAISVGAGFGASYHWDTPTGPSIVLSAFLIFMAHLLALKLLKRSSY